MYHIFTVIVITVCILQAQCNTALPGLIGNIKTSSTGFISLMKNTSETDPIAEWNLIISRFHGMPFSTDYVSMVRAIGSNMEKLTEARVEDISDKLSWPNEPGSIPDEVFGRGDMILIPSGFLVPTKGVGALTIFDLNEQDQLSPYNVVPGGDGDWFYHRALWVDMDGDGKLDIVACRAQKPFFGNPKGQMIWLKQPDFDKPWTKEWQETILVDGDGAPDTFMIAVKMKTDNGSSIQTLITAGFFSKSLDVWWRKNEDQPWTRDNINKRVLDNTEGDTFDLLYEDINLDGKQELLVTYNKAANGTMMVYEIPGDFRTGTLTKHLIIDGINPATKGVGKGSPGSMKLAWPVWKNRTTAPDIILSGDDNGQLFLLRAKNLSQWDYDKHVILDDRPGTVGEMAVGDVDMDSYTDIIIPCYNSGKITVLSYSRPGKSKTGKNATTVWQKICHLFNNILSLLY